MPTRDRPKRRFMLLRSVRRSLAELGVVIVRGIKYLLNNTKSTVQSSEEKTEMEVFNDGGITSRFVARRRAV